MSIRTKQVLSVLFTIAVYTLVFKGNWKVALLFAVGVGFHEYGHLWAARRMGLQTAGFYLMPFMGGVALVAGRYRTYGQQAFVVLMGPIWGSVLAVISLGMYYLTHQDFFLRAAAWMGWLNMLNLLPLSFMDGGQLMGTINYSINRTLGMVCHAASTAIAVVVLFFMNPLISLLVMIFGVPNVIKEIKNWYHTRNGESWLVSEEYLYQPDKLSIRQMFLTGGIWLSLGTALLFMVATISKMPGGSIMGLFK